MSDAFDALDDEVAEGARSPVSGVTSAVAAGEALSTGDRRRVIIELPAYLIVQIAWFTAFGLQMVVFPYLLKNELGVSGTLLGAAQMALSLPSVIFILIGGVIAERTDGRTLLILFHALAAVPGAMLAFAIGAENLTYWLMIAYAVGMGTVGAFMMPARDAILNEVIDRRIKSGSKITLQQGVAFATIAQFAAQIVGLSLGGMATSWGAQPLMIAQAVVVASGAVAALWLSRGRMMRTSQEKKNGVLADIGSGMATVRRDPIIMSMVASMFGVGLFVIGAFLVVLPIINADVYNMNSGGLRNIYITFWAGAFVSSVILSTVPTVNRPGQWQLLSHFIGAACILVLIYKIPYLYFLSLVFIWGLCAGVSITMSRSIVQKAAPKDKLARVLSIYQLGFMGGAPLGAAAMGLLTDLIGPQLVALAPAIGLFSLVFCMIAFTPLWRLRANQLVGATNATPAQPDDDKTK